MRKQLTIACTLLLLLTMAITVLAAGAFRVVSAPTPGDFHPTGITAGRLHHIQVEGADPDNGTLILSRISDDLATTNALITLTAASGAINNTLGNTTNIWLMAGDKLLRSGTITNECRVRLIVAESP